MVAVDPPTMPDLLLVLLKELHPMLRLLFSSSLSCHQFIMSSFGDHGAPGIFLSGVLDLDHANC